MFLLVGLATLAGPAAAQRAVPYWASITASVAKMRSGPSQQFPSTWIYRRTNLPVKVVQRHGDWRRVEDPDGTQGWMSRVLLSERRTAIVVGGVTTIHDAPSAGARVNWRVEPGVVGRLEECETGWCRFDIRGRIGFIRQASLWGPGEP